MTVRDDEWHDTTARIIRKTQAPVLPVFFGGRNGALFQMAGLIHPRLRTALLPRAFRKCRGKTLDVRIGHVVPHSKLETFQGDREMLDYLRMRTFMLGADGRRATAKKLTAMRRRKQHQVPAAAPMTADAVGGDVTSLPHEQRLLATGDYEVWYATAKQVPNVLHEIGRLRELTFREISEGTGLPTDLDRFDDYYLHLFAWQKAKREVVGAYRLGRTDEILPVHGRDGLYTSTLYKFAPQLFAQINPALELGRSFVRPEYQKQHLPMAMLWRGIGAYIVQHPKYKILFGPVGISDEYQSRLEADDDRLPEGARLPSRTREAGQGEAPCAPAHAGRAALFQQVGSPTLRRSRR